MGDLQVKQVISLIASRAPVAPGAAVVSNDFEIKSQTYSNTDMSEDMGVRIAIAANATGISIPLGTVALGALLVVDVESDIILRITNAAGTSQNLRFSGGRPSVLWLQGITALVADNPNNDILKGRLFVCGD